MKTIIITANESLQEVKDQFQNGFKNLKLEFFHKNHEVGEGNDKKDLIEELNLKVSDFSSLKEDFQLSIDGHKKVSTLESDFAEIGINAQVFRKSGDVWLLTTTTDDWTLAKQNNEGESILN